MKWKTRDGMELEGTIEEYAAFVKLDIFRSISDVPQTTTTPVAKVEEKTIILTPVHRKEYPEHRRAAPRKYIYNAWTQEELAWLKEKAPEYKTLKQLCKKFNREFPTKRSLNAVYIKARTMDLALNTGLPVRDSHYDVVAAAAKKRMQFVQDRAKYYMNSYGWSYEKARSQGFSDAANHSGLQKHKSEVVVERRPEEPKKSVELPLWFPLNHEEETRTLWKNMLGIVVWSKGNITYTDMNFLHLRNGYDWSYELWDEFLSWFVMNTENIAKYFKVPNKFKVKNGNVIVYEDDAR